MTKNEYMNTLANKLHRLPKEDYHKAIAYFEEYFAEAGEENEQQAIKDLGDPKYAANELIMNLALKNAKQPPKTLKHGFASVWIGVLAVCAAPVALPLAGGLLVTALGLIGAVLLVILGLFLAAVLVAASGIIAAFSGGILLFSAFADGLSNIGLGFIALGAGILLTYSAFIFCRWFLRRTSKSLGNTTRRRKEHENNH